MRIPRPLLPRTFHPRQRAHGLPRPLFYRQIHATSRFDVVKPFLLADIGEGITECQLIQWFVQPGARVEQFDKLCEVQSDKASVEITSPFDGVIKKLHYEPDDMAITGKPLVDIDIQSELSPEDEAKLGSGEEEKGGRAEREGQDELAVASNRREEVEAESVGADHAPASTRYEAKDGKQESGQQRPQQSSGDRGTLATPAVRHLIKEHNLDIAKIEGTGKDGRVLKEDIQRHVSRTNQTGEKASTIPVVAHKEDRKVALTPVQNQMFKKMTRSLHIPHFLYTSSVDMAAVSSLRQRLDASGASPNGKITHLAFVLKAVSAAFRHHPLLNASLDTTDPKKPQLTHRGRHHFGIAVDTPAGLLVPVVRDVQDLSIAEIAARTRQIAEAARGNRLAPGDFDGATFTVSNIGSIGGGVVAPVISEPQVAILGVGRSKFVPAFDDNDQLTKKEELVLSWSADHRVVDGAECARCAERVRKLLENPASMLVELR